MLEAAETIHWPVVIRPHGEAERALGRLAFALESTPFYGTWLWRELTRTAVVIVQASGHLAKTDQLRLALIGLPVEREDNNSGLAAAKRVFLAATPLFRASDQTDRNQGLWPAFWQDGSLDHDHGHGDAPIDGAGEGALAERRLQDLVRELASFAGDGTRPALVNLLVDLRRHAAIKAMSPHLVRLALPLALINAGVIPKAAPGLLGGRRLPLGMSRASIDPKPLTAWLVAGFTELAKEAKQASRRLSELTRQHRAWQGALIHEGLRKHARLPRVLDLLAATPVLSIGLVARHLGCSHVAAGKMIERLVGLGILIEQSSRARHKLFIAGDLPTEGQLGSDPDGRLSLSEPLSEVDVDGIEATLDGLFADLDRLNQRVTKAVDTEGGRCQ